ncbi:MAG TPA: hypothetical protein VN174_03120 [Candidatus Methanoperedens sp.]|nr:hypothetical protein [Candidatus Methanoperedens sp.]
MTLLDRVIEKPFIGFSANEIVKRGGKDYDFLATRYGNSTSGEFNPYDDGRLADCYNFLYKREKEEVLSLDRIKSQVDRNMVSAGRLVMASWLNAFMYVHEGKVDWELTETLIDNMRAKGDGVLMASSDALNIPSLKQEFFDPKVQVDSWVAISLGSKQMIEMMNREGVFQNNPELYEKMSEGALIRREVMEGK